MRTIFLQTRMRLFVCFWHVSPLCEADYASNTLYTSSPLFSFQFEEIYPLPQKNPTPFIYIRPFHLTTPHLEKGKKKFWVWTRAKKKKKKSSARLLIDWFFLYFGRCCSNCRISWLRDGFMLRVFRSHQWFLVFFERIRSRLLVLYCSRSLQLI